MLAMLLQKRDPIERSTDDYDTKNGYMVNQESIAPKLGHGCLLVNAFYDGGNVLY